MTIAPAEVGQISGGSRPFEIDYRRLNCFHEAVVVEVHGEGPHRLVERHGDAESFLPHLTLGYVREPGPADELRSALLPLRDARLGMQLVDEVLVCSIPAGRSTLLRPWTVAERVPLRR